jgi:hypothetical protein
MLGVKLSRLQKWEAGVNTPRFTLPELRRLRRYNREVFDALLSGFVPLEAPVLLKLLTSSPQNLRAQPPTRVKQDRA